MKYIYEEIRDDDKEPQKFVGYEDVQYKPTPDGKPSFGVMTYDVSSFTDNFLLAKIQLASVDAYLWSHQI